MIKKNIPWLWWLLSFLLGLVLLVIVLWIFWREPEKSPVQPPQARPGSTLPQRKRPPRRLALSPRRPLPPPLSARTSVRPSSRPWRGRPSSLPSHEELLRRARQKYKANPNASRLPPPGDKFYVIQRETLKEWLKLPLRQSGARFLPEFTGGRPQGMRVTRVDPGSFYARLGLAKGDVILRLNGRRVISPGQTRKIFRAIAGRYRNITLRIRRGRRVRTIDFSLR